MSSGYLSFSNASQMLNIRFVTANRTPLLVKGWAPHVKMQCSHFHVQNANDSLSVDILCKHDGKRIDVLRLPQHMGQIFLSYQVKCTYMFPIVIVFSHLFSISIFTARWRAGWQCQIRDEVSSLPWACSATASHSCSQRGTGKGTRVRDSSQQVGANDIIVKVSGRTGWLDRRLNICCFQEASASGVLWHYCNIPTCISIPECVVCFPCRWTFCFARTSIQWVSRLSPP